MEKQNKNLIIALMIGALLTGLSIGITQMLGAASTLSLVETLAVFTSYSCVVLCVTQNRSNYFFGIVSTFLYVFVFYKAGLLALALFNGILVASLIYGYFRWGPDGSPLPITNVNPRGYLGYAVFGLVVFCVFYGIYKLTGTPINQLDVLTAVLSATAQLLLDNKKRQTWILWAIVNVISLVLFYNQGMVMVFIQYLLFLGNTIVAWFVWSRAMAEQK